MVALCFTVVGLCLDTKCTGSPAIITFLKVNKLTSRKIIRNFKVGKFETETNSETREVAYCRY